MFDPISIATLIAGAGEGIAKLVDAWQTAHGGGELTPAQKEVILSEQAASSARVDAATRLAEQRGTRTAELAQRNALDASGRGGQQPLTQHPPQVGGNLGDRPGTPGQPPATRDV